MPAGRRSLGGHRGFGFRLGRARVLVGSIVLGIVVKRYVKEATLQIALRVLLLAMGSSLLWKGISDAAT